MANFYCEISGQTHGPLSADQLRELARSGELQGQELVWREGTDEKVPARAVKGLFSQAAPPPPVPAVPEALQYAPTESVAKSVAVYREPSVTLPAPQTVAAEPVVKPDVGPFRKIGRMFNYTTGGKWIGPVVVSPVAIYVIKIGKAQNSQGVALGGLVGALIAAAAAGAPDDTRTCTVAELPVDLQSFIDPKRKRADKDVIVLPKDAISLVQFAGFNNVIKVECGELSFRLFTSFFKGGHKKFMTDNGWTLNAQLTPVASAVHGRGFGRDPGAPPPRGMHPALRVLFVILGILLFIAVVWLRVMNSR